MFEMKRLSKEGVGAALQKAERYRLLNEPSEAESICRDVLHVDPTNTEARVTLLLALTDQFGGVAGSDVNAARAMLSELAEPYQRAYYGGIICERWAKAIYHRHSLGSGAVVHHWLTDAMKLYEAAQELTQVLNGTYRFAAELTSQLGVLPSYTKLGMASLLPHQTLT